jgi:hypothetical protein
VPDEPDASTVVWEPEAAPTCELRDTSNRIDEALAGDRDQRRAALAFSTRCLGNSGGAPNHVPTSTPNTIGAIFEPERSQVAEGILGNWWYFWWYGSKGCELPWVWWRLDQRQFVFKFGADGRIRTGDPLFANQAAIEFSSRFSLSMYS